MQKSYRRQRSWRSRSARVNGGSAGVLLEEQMTKRTPEETFEFINWMYSLEERKWHRDRFREMPSDEVADNNLTATGEQDAQSQ